MQAPGEFETTFSLYRYFIWGDRMRVHFNTVLRAMAEENPSGDRLAELRFDAELYMSYWYGGLYVIIEGWRKLGLHDGAIDMLLSSPNVELLRRYRNGVFHFQKKYFDDRFIEFIRDGENAVQWVRSLRDAFSGFFLQRFPERPTS